PRWRNTSSPNEACIIRGFFSPGQPAALPFGASVGTIKIGICGLGTVGYGSYTVLRKNARELARRVGSELVVSHIGSRALRPGQDIGNTRFSNDVFAVVEDPEVDIVLELMGGTDVARDLVLRAIARGKH